MSFFTNVVGSFNSAVGSINSAVDSVVDSYKTSQTLPNSIVKVGNRYFKLKKLLGEGGFSFVYLAEDEQRNLYAVKVIRCKMGKEVADNARREAMILTRFKHKNIIEVVDMCMIKEEDGGRTIYIIMPFYKNGNIQDMIDNNNVTGNNFEEKEMLRLFREVCISVKVLAQYKNRAGRFIPWAHRDIKPANVLISDDGLIPVLMDFGSARPARVEITDRRVASEQQDDAAENCSMPYRAPELFDVKVGTTLDEKVDVWSLGCTLFAMAFGESPFEMTINQQGGSIALAVLNRQFYFPQSKRSLYSQNVQDLITFMLNVDPIKRPDISAVIEKLNKLIL